MELAVSNGRENRIAKEIVSVLYRNSSMRPIAMRGGRKRKIITIKLMAPPVVEIVRTTSDAA